jgi:hypothetical protein
MSNLIVSVQLRLKNELTAALGAAVKDSGKQVEKMTSTAAKAVKEAGRQIEKSTAAVVAAVIGAGRQTEKTYRDTANASLRDTTRFNRAYEALGIRSNRSIEREIRRTEAAYDRLRRSGTLSMREQARAADAARGQIHELRLEMGHLTGMQKASMVRRTAIGVVAGAAAAGYVVKPKVEQAMAYDLRLAQMANTAFADRDLPGRKAGMVELNDSIKKSLQYGGGRQDDAAGALDNMIASGTIPVRSAKSILKDIMLAATSSGADAINFSDIAVRGMQNMHATEKDIPKFFNIATSAGQQGGFEIKDMARWLPAQMAVAGSLGMRGQAGFAKLVALDQAAITAAGSKDEAGNNVVNLLAKINSPDTAKDAKKLGIDMPSYLAENRKNGVDAVDAFVNLIQKEVRRDPLFNAVSSRAAGSKNNDEKRAMYEDMANIVQGKGAGTLIQDRQALMALMPLLANPQYMKDVEKKSLADNNSVTSNAALIKTTASFKTQQLGNEKLFSEQALFEKMAPAIGRVADGMTEMARKYPGLTMATTAATTALTALAAAAGAAGLASIATGGGRTAAVGALGSVAGMAGKAGLVGLAGLAGYGIGTVISKAIEGTAVSNAIGASIAHVLAFFGDKEAQDAVRINASLDKAQQQPKATVEGTLKIVIDDQGRASAVKVVKPLGPGVNIDTGYVMGAS